jgi:hypothetical protein
VPISRFQSRVLLLLAGHRDPESFVGGGVPINRDGPRFSADIDIFHDRAERVAGAAETDAQTLRDAGLKVDWVRRLPALYTAIVTGGDEQTRLDWITDSDVRFFPALRDEQFGYVLHVADLAVNKLMAAVGRREPRDAVDLVTIDEKFLPLGAVAWAAVEVAPGFTPEGLLAELSRSSRFSAEEFAALASVSPIDPADISRKLRSARERAEVFVARMPSELAGALFLKDGTPVQPDPARLDEYRVHRPQRRGHWPTSSEIGSAMLDRYGTSDPAPQPPSSDKTKGDE